MKSSIKQNAVPVPWWKRLNIVFPVLIGLAFLSLYIYFVQSLAYRDNTNRHPFDRLWHREKRAISALDGIAYPQAAAQRHALGVMIENYPDARPQFGLSQASIVYEAMTEGGITRFLAIFGPLLPAKVGPVRSARTYYLDWCLEYDCFYAHVGGNIDALDLIPTLKIKDLDQFRYGVSQYGRTYFRVPKQGIATEHTMFTVPSRLYDLAKANSWPLTDNSPKVRYKAESSYSVRPVAQLITIPISSQQYEVKWLYDKKSNSYTRLLAGQPHIDAGTGESIKSKVVIVQEVPTKEIKTRINEPGLAMETIGKGKASIFQDGQQIVGSWEKSTTNGRTVFKDSNNNNIRYDPGQRWITVVNPGTPIKVQ